MNGVVADESYQQTVSNPVAGGSNGSSRSIRSEVLFMALPTVRDLGSTGAAKLKTACGLTAPQGSTQAAAGQVVSDGYDVNAFDCATEQGAEVPLIAGQEMTASCLNRSQQDRLILRDQLDALWQCGCRRGLVGDLDLLNKTVQPRATVRRIEVSFRLGNSV